MTNWIRQQLKGKLFRKVFLATLISSIIPIGVMILFLIRSEFSANEFPSRFSPQFFIIMFNSFFSGWHHRFFSLTAYFSTHLCCHPKAPQKLPEVIFHMK